MGKGDVKKSTLYVVLAMKIWNLMYEHKLDIYDGILLLRIIIKNNNIMHIRI